MELFDDVDSILDHKGHHVWFIGPEATVFDAIRWMSEKNVGALLVIESCDLLGIISERDYTRKVILMDRSSKHTKVHEIMTKGVKTHPVAPNLETWVPKEMTHAIDHWRKQFRGEAPVKNDSEVTEADIASSNLVLWGDPGSNRILARIAAQLPLGPQFPQLGGRLFPETL